MDPRLLDDHLHAAPQINLADIPEAAKMGYRALISNRPDAEDPTQPSAADIAAAAEAAGLAFRHVPVTGSGIGEGDIAAMRSALIELPGPILGFCRSGMRTTVLWALASSGDRTPDEIISAAGRAGYDLEGLRPRLTYSA